MGAWGWKPFQNDEVLDAFGELRTSNKILQAIKDTFSRGAYFIPSYEIGALLCDSFKKTHYIVEEKNIEQIIKIVRENMYLGDLSDLLHESVNALLSVCTISIDTREKLLELCKSKLDNNIKNFIKDGEDKELIANMREMYKNIENILADFESNRNKAFLISDSELSKLAWAEKNLKKICRAECIAKFRDTNGIIKRYRLKHSARNIKDVASDNLKTAILNYQIIVKNLKITADGRLIDKDSSTPIKSIQV